MHKIVVGTWRKAESGPMQVISGPIGKEKILFGTPHAKTLKREMTTFLKWFQSENNIDPVLQAGLAHLWFVTVHPFEVSARLIQRCVILSS